MVFKGITQRLDGLKVLSGHKNHRIVGSTESYQVKGWSLNHYQCEGVIRSSRGEVIPFSPHCVVLFPPNYSREFEFTRAGEHDVIHFELPEYSNSPSSKPSLFQCSPRDLMGRYFEDILRLHTRQSDRVNLILKVLLYDLEDRYGMEKNILSDHVAEEAYRWIQENLDQPISVAGLAQQLSVSHNHLTRVFKKYFGMTVIQSIQNMRIEKLSQLLEQTNLPIKAMVHEVGCQNMQQLNKLVHKMTGMSPRGLEQRYRKG